MKKIKISLFFIFILSVLGHSFSQQKNNFGNITVKIIEPEFNHGQIVISLLNSIDSYTSDKNPPFKYTYIKADSSTSSIIYTFENIPFGKYAIQLFYDKNTNNKLDTYFGIPREKYGFSNNIKPVFSKPKYEEISFDLNQENIIQQIILR